MVTDFTKITLVRLAGGRSQPLFICKPKPALVIEIDVLFKRLIDEEHTSHPLCYSHKITE